VKGLSSIAIASMFSTHVHSVLLQYSNTPILQYSSSTDILFPMKNSRERTEGDGDEWNAPWGAAARTTDLTGAFKEDSFAQECSSDLPSMATSWAPSGSPPFTLSRSPPPASKLDPSECSPDNQDHRAVPDGFEVPEVRTKCYQRPVYRWISLGSILFGLAGAIALLVVLVIRPQSAASSSSLAPSTPVATTAAPTKPDPSAAPRTPVPITGAPASAPISSPMSEPTSSTPEQIACNFLSIPNVTKCRSTVDYYGSPTGPKIPSEIGLLTQLTFLTLRGKSLTSTIPSEIGLLTQLKVLHLYSNSLTSTIPSEIGLLSQLMDLSFYDNQLTSTIPSEIGFLTQLEFLWFNNNTLKGTIPASLCSLSPPFYISIDCSEITCDCCDC
jgi:hypothetical protein